MIAIHDAGCYLHNLHAHFTDDLQTARDTAGQQLSCGEQFLEPDKYLAIVSECEVSLTAFADPTALDSATEYTEITEIKYKKFPYLPCIPWLLHLELTGQQ